MTHLARVGAALSVATAGMLAVSVPPADAGPGPALIAATTPVADAGPPSTAHPAASSCGGNVIASPVKYTYSKAGTAVLGHPGYKLTYSYTVSGNKFATLQGKGFDKSGKAHWYRLGSGGGTVQVPWGNVGAYPEVRAWNAAGMSTIYWSC